MPSSFAHSFGPHGAGEAAVTQMMPNPSENSGENSFEPDGTEALSPEILALVPEYVAGRFLELRRLESALAAGDFATVENIGHNFKGTGSSFGFPALTSAGAAIEAAAQHRNSATVLHFASVIESVIAAY